MKRILLLAYLLFQTIAFSQIGWDSLYTNLERDFDKGNYQNVLNEIPALLEKATTEYGSKTKEIAHSHLLKAECLIAVNKHHDAIIEIQAALEIYKSIDNTSLDYAYANHVLGKAYFNIKKYDKSESALLTAGVLYEQKLGPRSEFYFYLLKDLLALYQTTENTEGVYTIIEIYAPLEEELLGYENSENGESYLLLAKLAFDNFDFFGFENYALKALSILEQYSPDKKEEIAETTYLLTKYYFLLDEYHLIDPLLEEIEKIVDLNSSKWLGEKHEMNYMSGLSAYHLGDYNRAVEKLKTVEGKLEGDKNYNSLRFLGLAYASQGHKEKALEKLNAAIDYAEKNSIKKWHYAEILNDKAIVLNELAEYDQSIAAFEKALTYSSYMDNDLYMNVLSNLANIYGQLGNYGKAEALYLELMESLESTSNDRRLYLAVMNNLGMTYLDWGEYSKCELLLNECLKISYNTFGVNAKETANAKNNLGAFYFEVGNYGKSVDLFVAALSTYERIDGVKSASYSSVLNNIGLLFMEVGNYEDAAVFMDSVKTIEKDLIGEDHPAFAVTLNNMAQINLELGHYNKAIEQTNKALRIIENHFSIKHPDYALYEMNLGNIYKTSGQTDKASLKINSAHKKYINIYGEKHVTSSIAALQLAKLKAEMGHYSEAKNLFNESIDNLQSHLISYLPFLSEKEKSGFYNRYIHHFYDYFQFINSAKNQHPELQTKAFNLSLTLKGMLLRSSRAMRNVVLNSGNQKLIYLYDEWVNLKKRIADLSALPIDQRGKDLASLEQKANEYEKKLFQLSDELGAGSFQTATLEEIRGELLKNEAVIEFVSYFDRLKEKTVYSALILKQGDEMPKMVELFEEEKLVEIIDFYGANNFDYISKIYHYSSSNKTKLYDLIWGPIEPHLGNAKRIFVSSTGLLHKVSLYAIATGENEYLIDAYELISLNSSGDLKNREEVESGEMNNVALMGGIQYDTERSDKEVWAYLPGTKEEVESINTVLTGKQKKVEMKTSSDATETFFKSVAERSDVLHIATHGFFFPDPIKIREILASNQTDEPVDEVIEFRGKSQVVGVSSFTQNKNPLMRSGLVFSGVHDLWSEQRVVKSDDGILTAMEVAQLDLHDTELAILSACETGLGEIKGNEGVYGLKRTFKIAGVDHLIISLWQVPDKETKEFMIYFYERLYSSDDVTVYQAFEYAQRTMREKYDPYFWAAFILIR
ncbi:MAG: CHAT domain-containing protein [Crocinitomicaceae bacterium]